VTGELFDHLTCWDALRAAMPVGTVSGAPKTPMEDPTHKRGIQCLLELDLYLGYEVSPLLPRGCSHSELQP
ncbi:uncharacterized protein A4U43_C07F20, partial [Asparagus officinalis]